ncbi:sugar nucleotide-binding protein [Brachybacterium saurashtrense]|uniref:SDR family NAD(P)-dependent oxidoreductase n=1 Tax=Brachybacterium saurashtrense TaxID=556288 RepID=A0A345YQR0_9MICO|nr:sugar nucleotide-binding protein [Brachybacterium saurashtrense]AXK46262.1 SDR family NAD(P)-dependent oxidoreductase [Brachybacterium saurashtrense]RRR24002.1 SDR family NAD(P)-dependent oxidoreductase [Brachybacterium saurashtrense]
MTTRTLLVGCGRVGLRVGELLRADGGAPPAEVLGLRRDPSSLPEGFVPIAADLSAPLPSPLPAVDAMVITLAPSVAASYREPLAHLAAALPGIPSCTVFVSSTRVLEGYDASRPLTEADPARPRSDRARVLLEGEERARELFGAVVLRPAGIYGPGRDRLLRTVLEGRPVEHERHTNRIHEADLARAIVALLSMPDPPALLHASDGAPARLGEIVAHLAARLDVPVPPRAAPDPAAGTVLDATALHRLLGTLEVPDFRAGYDAMLRERPLSR